MEKNLDIKKLAEYEIRWWQAHHRRDKAKLIANQVKKHAMLFGVSEATATKAMEYFFHATKEHDIAEEFEDKGNTVESNVHWKKCEQLLEQYYKELLNG